MGEYRPVQRGAACPGQQVAALVGTILEQLLDVSLGARKADILKQFLFEAVTLATMGGAVGIFLAWVIGKLVTAAIFPTYLSLAAILGALAVSGSAGAVSGLFPAWKAARLDPIEALRADT